MTGKLILSGINNVAKNTDKNFLITRSNRTVPSGFTLLTELAPSSNLFGQALLWKDAGVFEQNFLEYRAQYIEELGTAAIAKIADMVTDGFIVQLTCYCTDPYLCHRSILYDIFEAYGLHVELR